MFPLHVLSVDGQGQVLGHDTVLVNGLNASSLEVFAEVLESFVVIELGSVKETASPGEDGGDGVRRGLVALLPFTVVSGDSSYKKLDEKGLIQKKCGLNSPWAASLSMILPSGVSNSEVIIPKDPNP